VMDRANTGLFVLSTLSLLLLLPTIAVGEGKSDVVELVSFNDTVYVLEPFSLKVWLFDARNQIVYGPAHCNVTVWNSTDLIEFRKVDGDIPLRLSLLFNNPGDYIVAVYCTVEGYNGEWGGRTTVHVLSPPVELRDQSVEYGGGARFEFRVPYSLNGRYGVVRVVDDVDGVVLYSSDLVWESGVAVVRTPSGVRVPGPLNVVVELFGSVYSWRVEPRVPDVVVRVSGRVVDDGGVFVVEPGGRTSVVFDSGVEPSSFIVESNCTIVDVSRHDGWRMVVVEAPRALGSTCRVSGAVEWWSGRVVNRTVYLTVPVPHVEVSIGDRADAAGGSVEARVAWDSMGLSHPLLVRFNVTGSGGSTVFSYTVTGNVTLRIPVASLPPRATVTIHAFYDNILVYNDSKIVEIPRLPYSIDAAECAPLYTLDPRIAVFTIIYDRILTRLLYPGDMVHEAAEEILAPHYPPLPRVETGYNTVTLHDIPPGTHVRIETRDYTLERHYYTCTRKSTITLPSPITPDTEITVTTPYATTTIHPDHAPRPHDTRTEEGVYEWTTTERRGEITTYTVMIPAEEERIHYSWVDGYTVVHGRPGTIVVTETGELYTIPWSGVLRIPGQHTITPLKEQ